MDLRAYYQKVRQVEACIADEHVVVISCETPDGGKAGVKTEVPRTIAAKLVVEGRANLASAKESAEFREEAADAARKAGQLTSAAKLQRTVLSETERQAPRGTIRVQKD